MTMPVNDHDPIETKEWVDALASLVKVEGKERAQFVLMQLMQKAAQHGLTQNTAFVSDYVNTIMVDQQPDYPGDLDLEAKIEACIRWNAIVMVLRAKLKAGGVGGHLSSFASIATLYEVGMNHFFRGSTPDAPGDMVFFQGHSSEGNYARAFIEGRLTEQHLEFFRQEVSGEEGLSSYPHPWLMPQFWQFATVSLGLGMLQGVYQARFLKYLQHRELIPQTNRKVWVFCGDGEMDEPESIAGLTLAAREKLDNLIFVVNCNLQRLDGLVRGNYKIVQELESLFRGAGWHVIKVLWDTRWDALFAKDTSGALTRRLNECVDGDLQNAYIRGAEYLREFLFNTEELKALIAGLGDSDLDALHRGAHDPIKIYAAYHAAVNHSDQPVVILAHGVKGYGLGKLHAEGRNIAHNQLEMGMNELTAFRERFSLPLTEQDLTELRYYALPKDSAEFAYLKARREMLGGYLPQRRVISQPLLVPELKAFAAILKGSEDRTMSTTMVLGRILNVCLKDKNIGSRIAPIFSDEVRTFGLEALFRQVGIYSPVGQLYIPEDKEQFLYYHEVTNGQVLEEGITEAGCMASWLAAAVSYMANDFPMIPVFTYYSMFGFQRVGDFIWAAADMRARGFLIGATAGRTTLEGEGLQHQDGTSLLVASTVPSCRAYDPAFGYELAVIMQHGMQEMFAEQKDVFYYITAMNERYIQPSMPEGVEAGIIKGMYLLDAPQKKKAEVQLLGSGAILNEVLAAAHLLKEDFKLSATVWSVTSFSELAREARTIERSNLKHPDRKAALSYVEKCLSEFAAPIIAASDYVRAHVELIRPHLPHPYYTLGTDGYGRSDTRAHLRAFFEVDRYHIAVTALYALSKAGKVPATIVLAAMKKYGIDPEKPDPVMV